MISTGSEHRQAAASDDAIQAGNAQAIADRIANSIALGLLAVGERLPPEIELAQQFGVAVATLRKGLAVLRERGIVVTHRGRSGGSFVVKAPFPTRSESEDQLHSISVVELRDLRDELIAVGAATAGLAAQRAWEGSLGRLENLLPAVASAANAADAASADSRFHIEVAVLAQSRRLLSAELRLQSESTPILWAQQSYAQRGADVEHQHREVLAAIASGNRERAANAMAAHISDDVQRVINLKLSLEAPGT